MDTSRLSQGQMIAGIAAVALFIISFLPWFGAPQISGVGPSGATVTVGGNFNLWEAENPLDIYLLLVIVLAIAPAGMALLGGREAPLAPFAITLLAGVGTLMILYQVFDNPGDLDRKIGLFLGLIACAGITVGGYLQMQEDVGSERY